MGSKRASEHDNIMSLLIIAFSQADSKAIVNNYNTVAGKERQSLMLDRPQEQGTTANDAPSYCSNTGQDSTECL